MAASSSGSSQPIEPAAREPLLQPKHDIFLSHSGKQKDFVESLCEELERLHYHPFFDIRHDSLPKGQLFPRLILKAAKQCKVAVVVLSEQFVQSKWPMIELATFVRSARESPSLNIFPLFYKLGVGDLSDHNIDKWLVAWKKFAAEDSKGRINVEEWRQALLELRSWNGEVHSNHSQSKLDYIRKVVYSISRLLRPQIFYDDTDVRGKDRLCKEISTRFEELSRSSSAGPSILGMYGMPGIGKSTLSQCLCNSFFVEFSGRVSYLELPTKPSSTEIVNKLKKVLTELTDLRDTEVSYLRQAQCILRERISRTEFFLAIDNVWDNSESLEVVRAILGCGLSKGCKILVTARSRDLLYSLLKNHGRHLMHVPVINEDAAVCIFLDSAVDSGSTLSAFPSEEHGVILGIVRNFLCEKAEGAEGVVPYHPLVMKAIGRVLSKYGEGPSAWREKVNKPEFKAMFNKEHNVENLRKLIKMSYEELCEEAKFMFLDIALLFSEQSFALERVCSWLSVVHKSDTEAIVSWLKVLKHYGFVGWKDRLRMHDLYREFAETVVEGDSRYLWSRGARELDEISAEEKKAVRRIYIGEAGFEIGDLQGYSKVEALWMKECKSLRDLKVWGMASLVSVDIEGCPKLRNVEGQSLLCNVRQVRWVESDGDSEHDAVVRKRGRFFGWGAPRALEVGRLRALQRLEMRGIGVESLSGLGHCSMLQELIMVRCCKPKGQRAGTGKGLEAPDLSRCLELQTVEVRKSSLKGFPKLGKQTKLRRLFFTDNRLVTELPDLSTAGGSLAVLVLRGCTRLQKITSFDGLTSLEMLHLRDCEALEELPDLSIAGEALESLDLDGCRSLKKIASLHGCTALLSLNLEGCPVTEVPGLWALSNLEVLDVGNCRRLTSLHGVGDLVNLEVLYCSGCEMLGEVPDLSKLSKLCYLRARECTSLTTLTGFEGLTRLETIDVGGCKSMSSFAWDVERLPPSSLAWVRVEGCDFASDGELLLQWIGGPSTLLQSASAGALAWLLQQQQQQEEEEEKEGLRGRLMAAAIMPRLLQLVRQEDEISDPGHSLSRSLWGLMMELCWEKGRPHEASIAAFVQHFTPQWREVHNHNDFDGIPFLTIMHKDDRMTNISPMWYRMDMYISPYFFGVLGAVAATGRHLDFLLEMMESEFLDKYFNSRQYLDFSGSIPCLLYYVATNPLLRAKWKADNFLKAKETIHTTIEDSIKEYAEQWHRDKLNCLGKHSTEAFYIDTIQRFNDLLMCSSEN